MKRIEGISYVIGEKGVAAEALPGPLADAFEVACSHRFGFKGSLYQGSLPIEVIHAQFGRGRIRLSLELTKRFKRGE